MKILINNIKNKKKFEAVIICGGYGTRMGKISKNLPKSLIKISDITVISILLDNLIKFDIRSILLIGHYKSNLIEDHIKLKYKRKRININIFIEQNPLGDFGGVLKIKNYLKKNFLYILGDIVTKFNYKKLYKFHFKNRNSLTIVTHKNSHYLDSDKILIDDNNIITGYLKKNISLIKPTLNLVNSGISLINVSLLHSSYSNNKLNYFQVLFKTKLIKKNKYMSYFTNEYIEDMGTLERIKRINLYFKNLNLYKKKIIIHFQNLKSFKTLYLNKNQIKLIRDANIFNSDVMLYLYKNTDFKKDVLETIDYEFAKYNIYFNRIIENITLKKDVNYIYIKN